MPALPVMLAVKRYDTYVYCRYLLMGEPVNGRKRVSHQHDTHPHLHRLSRKEGFPTEDSAGGWKVL